MARLRSTLSASRAPTAVSTIAVRPGSSMVHRESTGGRPYRGVVLAPKRAALGLCSRESRPIRGGDRGPRCEALLHVDKELCRRSLNGARERGRGQPKRRSIMLENKDAVANLAVKDLNL